MMAIYELWFSLLILHSTKIFQLVLNSSEENLARELNRRRKCTLHISQNQNEYRSNIFKQDNPDDMSPPLTLSKKKLQFRSRFLREERRFLQSVSKLKKSSFNPKSGILNRMIISVYTGDQPIIKKGEIVGSLVLMMKNYELW